MEPRIEFETDVFSATGLTLLVEGKAQSHVDPVDPTRLFFEYTRRIGHVIVIQPRKALWRMARDHTVKQKEELMLTLGQIAQRRHERG